MKRSHIKDLTQTADRLSGNELSRVPLRVEVEATITALDPQGDSLLMRICDGQGDSPMHCMTARISADRFALLTTAGPLDHLVGKKARILGRLSKPLLLAKRSPANLVLAVDSLEFISTP